MSTHGQHTIDSPTPPNGIGAGKFVEYDEFIEEQLRKTRSQVRLVEIATDLMALVAGTLAFFFLAAMLDHWLVWGGLGFWSRTVLLVGYLLVASWWTITRIVPLCFKRINPLYAAQTIETSRPTLKNSLLNFLLFRADRTGIHQRVFEAIEEQAATNLVGVPVESAVDRTRVIRWGYVLVAIVALCAIYAVVSPKSLFLTVGRVVMPWARISPPTSTVIDELEPGNVQAFRGQQVTVKARVQGLPDDEKVTLYYTTADRQIVDRAVEMALPPNEFRYVAVLPAADATLQQSLTYRIEAGDTRTPEYKIEVVAAPTIVVEAVEYKYPAYTGLLAHRVEQQGDLQGIEGTEVTLHALANQEVASAYVDFDCNESLELPLRGDGTRAKTTFKLTLGPDGQKPEHGNYQLIFKNKEGQRNPQPVKHHIEVTRDLPPEVQFVSPSREEIELPLDGAVDLEVVALDPDFALSNVKLTATRGGDTVVDQALLDEPWRGQFVKKYRFVPRQLKLKAGDTVEYRAIAVDNKAPQANQSETVRRRIRISAPTGRGRPGDQLAKNDTGADDNRQPGDNADPSASDPRQRDPLKTDDPNAQSNDNRMQDPADPMQDRGQPNADQTKGKDSPQSDPQTQDDAPSRDSQQPSGDSKQGKGSGDKQNGQSGSDGGKNSSDDSSQGDSQGGKSGQQQGGTQSDGGQSRDGTNGAGQDGAGQSGGQSGDDSQSSDSGQGGTQESVPSDGTNDGEAFERILQHRDEKTEDEGAAEEESGATSSQKQGEPGEGRLKRSPTDEQGAGGQQSQSGEGAESKSQQRAGESASDVNNAGEKAEEQSSDSRAEDNGESGGKQAFKKQPEQAGGQEETQKAGEQAGGQQSMNKAGEKGESKGAKQGEQGQGRSDAQKQSEKDSQQDRKGENSQSQNGKKSVEKQGTQQQKGSANQQGADERPTGEGAQDQAGEQGGDKQPGKPNSDQPAADEKRTPKSSNSGQQGGQQSTDGAGAQSQDDPMASSDQQPTGEQRPDAKGGEGQQQKGESGSGQKSDENQGSPSAQETAQPRDKSQSSDEGAEKPSRENQEQSPSNSKRESDSQGESDGDQSGGGERGGGQKSNQSGTGGAGENTAADEGAGQSDEPGDGDTSDRAGDGKEAAGQTGKSGQENGEGSSDQSGGTGGNKAGGDAGTSPQDSGKPSDQLSDSSGGNGGTQGGNRAQGEPKPGTTPSQQWQPGADSADNANLEYTRKATDLALEHLKHELSKDQPDAELLDQLGWTREQAEDFVQRWEKMRSKAGRTDGKSGTSQRDLDDTLRSLGLRPRGSQLPSNSKRDDRSQGYQESQRTTPPPEYSESFRAYTQGTARGGK